MNKNCTVCGMNYAPYKPGTDFDIFSYVGPGNTSHETKEVCPFHNPKSVYSNV